jgi:hypothetical protein
MIDWRYRDRLAVCREQVSRLPTAGSAQPAQSSTGRTERQSALLQIVSWFRSLHSVSMRKDGLTEMLLLFVRWWYDTSHPVTHPLYGVLSNMGGSSGIALGVLSGPA